MNLNELEIEMANIKSAFGSKLAECREFAGFPKSAQKFGIKSPNLIFKIESGQNFPNESTFQYFVELYEIEGRDLVFLQGLYNRGKEVKKAIMRKKRGWK